MAVDDKPQTDIGKNSSPVGKSKNQTEQTSGWKKTLIENVRLDAIALTIAIFVRVFIA